MNELLFGLLVGWFARLVYESMRVAARRDTPMLELQPRDVVVAIKGDERP